MAVGFGVVRSVLVDDTDDQSAAREERNAAQVGGTGRVVFKYVFGLVASKFAACARLLFITQYWFCGFVFVL